jgi:hypothetical protein
MVITFVFVIILFSCTHGRMAPFALLPLWGFASHFGEVEISLQIATIGTTANKNSDDIRLGYQQPIRTRISEVQ